MELAKLVDASANLLKLLADNDGTLNDWKYIPTYKEFVEMRAKGTKYRVAIYELSEKYNISKTQIEMAIRRLRKDIG